MRILITGATGFIGNHVINELLKTEHQIIATSRNKLRAKKFNWYGKVNYTPWSIGEKSNENLFEYFQKPDLCIHLAWDGLGNFEDELHESTYFENHLSFLSKLIQEGLPKVTITGTCLEYGLAEGELDESMRPSPTLPYSIAKNKLRIEIGRLQETYSFEFDWLRLFYMYGPGQNPKSILALLETQIEQGDSIFNMSGGEQVRDYLPVEKIAEIITNLALIETGCRVVNCCSGKPIKIVDLVTNFISQKNAKIELNLGHYPYPHYEPFEFWGNSNKLERLLK